MKYLIASLLLFGSIANAKEIWTHLKDNDDIHRGDDVKVDIRDMNSLFRKEFIFYCGKRDKFKIIGVNVLANTYILDCHGEEVNFRHILIQR